MKKLMIMASALVMAFAVNAATYTIDQGYNEDTFYYGDVSLDTAKTSDKITSTAAGQDFSLLLFDTDVSLADLATFEGNYVLYTGKSVENADPESGNKYAAFLRDGEIGAGNWQTMAVPEPTSGLLLLLGVAGLALKRRRA